MRAVWLLVVTALLAGCAAAGGGEERLTAAEQRLERLEVNQIGRAHV
mgnify:CR=1 FL=1